jgi:hypothetical protein
MKNEAISWWDSVSPSTSARTSALVRSSVGCSTRSAAIRSIRPGQRHAGLEEGGQRIVLVLDQLGVAAGQDDVGLGQHHRTVLVGHAHHVADDPQRDRRGDVGHDVDRPVAGLRLPAGPLQDVDDDVLHGTDELLEHPRGEDLGHDAADLGVPRIVHADQRAVELVEVRRDVGDGDRTLAGAEDRRLRADGLEVGVPGDRVVTRAALQARDVRLGEEGEGALPPQQVEDGVPLGRWAQPEVPVGEVDVVQSDWRGCIEGHAASFRRSGQR